MLFAWKLKGKLSRCIQIKHQAPMDTGVAKKLPLSLEKAKEQIEEDGRKEVWDIRRRGGLAKSPVLGDHRHLE